MATLDEKARELEQLMRMDIGGAIADWPCGYERPTIEPGEKNTSANPATNVVTPVMFVHFGGELYTADEAQAIGVALLAAGTIAGDS